MSHLPRIRRTLLLLCTFALAACAGESPSAPSAAPAAPAFSTGVPDYFVYFTRLTDLPRATATASALPRSGVGCYANEARSGEWRLQLTANQLAAFASAMAVGGKATIVWASNAIFHFSGIKTVAVWETITDSNGNTLLQRDSAHNREYGDNAGGTFDGEVDLAPAQKDLLLQGGSITVRIEGAAEARIHPSDCGVTVQGAQALWRMFVEPTLHIHP